MLDVYRFKVIVSGVDMKPAEVATAVQFIVLALVDFSILGVSQGQWFLEQRQLGFQKPLLLLLLHCMYTARSSDLSLPLSDHFHRRSISSDTLVYYCGKERVSFWKRLNVIGPLHAFWPTCNYIRYVKDTSKEN